MRKATGFVSILAFGLLGGVACNGGSVADGVSKDATAGFQLVTCTSDADCGTASACLPEKCDAACVPDASGRCVACPATAGGLCMPVASGGTAPAASTCFAGRLGDPAACDITADWGRKAVDTCAVSGAELIDLHALLTCPDGRPGGVAFTCCNYGDVKPTDPPPVPTPTPTGCVRIPVKADPANPDPKMAADQQCRAMGLALQDIQPDAPDAAGNVYLWWASCCGPTQPQPPVTGTCQELPFPGDPNVDPKEMATKLCSGTNLLLTDVKAGDMDSAGVVRTWFAVCCGAPVPTPVPDPTTCTRIPVKADPANPDPAYSDPKMAADQQCRAMGLSLQDIQPDAPDAAGNIYLWWASCCGPTQPQPPATGTCTEVTLTVAMADSTIDPKAQASTQCNALNLALQDLKMVQQDSTTGVATWVASCCTTGTPVDPTPPATSCKEIPVGDGTCDATLDLKGQAVQACQAMGAVLQDVKVRNTCADGTVGALIVTCCVATDPVQPTPDPKACTSTMEGSDSSCKDPDTWKHYAIGDCQQQGLTLVDVSPFEPCGDNLFRYMKYACCP